MANFTIRAARLAEAPALTALCMRSKAHWGYDAEFMRLSARTLKVPGNLIVQGRVLVAVDAEDSTVGVAAIAPMEADGDYDLDRLFVEPSKMRIGAGEVLFRAACDLARREGARRLVIFADPNAIGFYTRMGAVRIGDAPSDSIPGRTLPLFAFDLGA